MVERGVTSRHATWLGVPGSSVLRNLPGKEMDRYPWRDGRMEGWAKGGSGGPGTDDIWGSRCGKAQIRGCVPRCGGGG